MNKMNKDISNFNDELREKNPSEIIKWALEKSKNPILTTNFRPYEAAIIHLCTKVMPDIKVVWCDSGYNTKAIYIYAEKIISALNLNLKLSIPRLRYSILPEVKLNRRHQVSAL